jgi:hypothetical protein
MTALKRSVVGSGPMRAPGKSRPMRYRMKEVLPTEYWPADGARRARRGVRFGPAVRGDAPRSYAPRRRTMGLASKSEGFMVGE